MIKKHLKLFSPFRIKGLSLKNRITMAPMYVGYANRDGSVSPALLEHYRWMAASGSAMIVVENAAVHYSGLESPTTLRIDEESYLPGLTRLARAIKDEGALAFLQINHAGRYGFMADRVAPSPLKTGEIVPVELTAQAIDALVDFFASAARLVKEAGFDGVEIHGGTGYLLVQFLSPRTNHRSDDYGGSLENRMRFPLRVVDAIQQAVGKDYPVGYRFLADEWLPEGLHLDETALFARELETRDLAYLSVTAGTYDVFYNPEYLEQEKREAYMTHFAEAVKRAVPRTPVIASGRIRTPETANTILEEGRADLVGLARALFADPLWPKKAEGLVEEPIVSCEHSCSLCTKRAMIGRPAFCARWDKEHRKDFLERIDALEEA